MVYKMIGQYYKLFDERLENGTMIVVIIGVLMYLAIFLATGKM